MAKKTIERKAINWDKRPRPKMAPVPTVRPFVDNSQKKSDEERLMSHPFFRSLNKLFKS